MLPTICFAVLAVICVTHGSHVEWDDYQGWNYSQDDGRNNQDQFQGYPSNYPRMTSPDITSTEPTVPGHRVLLRGIFQQVLGPNFTSPGLKDLAFLSSGRQSLPLKSQVWDDQKSSYFPTEQGAQAAQAQHSAPRYELPDYIQPPPPPVLDYNYYQ